MLRKLRSKLTVGNPQGFTLIELMIVIAIIGILAAIAIPNFIAYRNKSFCAQAESDAEGVAAAIADYFSIAAHTDTPAIGDLNGGRGYTFSGDNAGGIAGINPNSSITITVRDMSSRCPEDYQAPLTSWGGIGNSSIPGVVTNYIRL